MESKINMMNQKLLVKECEVEKKTKSGILLPDAETERIVKCKVFAVANDCENDIEIGTVIYTDKNQLVKTRVDGEAFFICDEKFIYAYEE